MFLYILNNFLIFTLMKLFYNHGTTTISLFIFVVAIISNFLWIGDTGMIVVYKKIDPTIHKYKKLADIVETIALLVVIISKPLLQLVLKLSGQI